MEILYRIRQIVGVDAKTLSRLLNVTVHTYIGFEQGKMTPPPEILKMLAMIYRIDYNLLFGCQNKLDEDTIKALKKIEEMHETDKRAYLSDGILDNDDKLNYHNVKKIKDGIKRDMVEH